MTSAEPHQRDPRWGGAWGGQDSAKGGGAALAQPWGRTSAGPGGQAWATGVPLQPGVPGLARRVLAGPSLGWPLLALQALAAPAPATPVPWVCDSHVAAVWTPALGTAALPSVCIHSW